MKRGAMIGLGLFISGCAMDFAPASLLDEARVLALIPNPIEIDLSTPNAALELSAVRYLPETSTITASRWSFCPISSGVRGGFECVLPACQVELDEQSPGVVRVSAAGLAAECLSRLEEQGLPISNAGGEAPESVETSFRHQFETNEGTKVEAVARVRAYLRNAPMPTREHPDFVRVLFDGQPVSPGRTSIQVRENESLEIELEVQPGTGSAAEELYTSYLATAGRFERLRTDETVGQNTWTAESLTPDDRSSTLYFTARDGRGGQSVIGPFEVEILRTSP